MRYYCGKSIHGKKITDKIISTLINKGIDCSKVVYVEPFCGCLGVFRHICPIVKKSYANDLSLDLILLWKKVQEGTLRNPHIDKEKWLRLKTDTKSSAERAFAGFGCSFSGVWFNGYIADDGNNDMTYNSLVKHKDILAKTKFYSMDYRDFLRKVIKNPDTHYVVYLDPPYEETYSVIDGKISTEFDSDQFWDLARKYSKMKNVTLFISEFQAPRDFKEIWSLVRTSGMHNTSTTRTYKEKLWIPR